MDPLKIYQEAVKNVPVVKYAMGVAGLAAVIAIIKSLELGLSWLLFGIPILLVFMVLLIVLSSGAKGDAQMRGPLMVLIWSVVLLFIGCLFFLVSSAFFEVPKPLGQIFNSSGTDTIIHKKEIDTPIVNPIDTPIVDPGPIVDPDTLPPPPPPKKSFKIGANNSYMKYKVKELLNKMEESNAAADYVLQLDYSESYMGPGTHPSKTTYRYFGNAVLVVNKGKSNECEVEIDGYNFSTSSAGLEDKQEAIKQVRRQIKSKWRDSGAFRDEVLKAVTSCVN